MMNLKKLAAGVVCTACMCALPCLSADDSSEDQEKKIEYSDKVLELDKRTGKVPVAYGLFGHVISAEISFADVKFADTEGNEYDRSHYDPIYNFNTTAWAQIIVQVTGLPETAVGGKSWTLSRFDFVLVFKGKPYKCLAVAPLNDDFSMAREKWKFVADGKDPNKENVYRLIFPLPRKDIPEEAEADIPGAAQNFTGDTDLLLVRTNDASLKVKMPVSKIQFRFMGDKPFTTAAAVLESAKGTVCGVSAAQLEEALKKPEPPAEEKPAEEKTTEEKPAEEKPAEEKPAEEKATEEKPAEAAQS